VSSGDFGLREKSPRGEGSLAEHSMLLLDHLAGRFLFKVKVAFDAEPEFTLEGLQLIQGKISLFELCRSQTQ
jgi:hypothetical protein